jgi:hypothetical protein
MKLASDHPLFPTALRQGAMPETVEPGQVFELTDHLLMDGSRWPGRSAHDHTRIRIVSVPGGRRRVYRYVKVDPQPGGNGRRDRGEHTIAAVSLVRNYRIVEREEDGDAS